MQITELIGHPELLNRDTLYELRRVVGQCPYYQAARLLLVENLFLLHDPDFKEELQAAALYVPDRSVLFQLVESLNYDLDAPAATAREREEEPVSTGDRTMDLIGQFLRGSSQPPLSPGRPGRPVDPVNDYMSVLAEMDDAETDSATERSEDLLDSFLNRKPEERKFHIATEEPQPEDIRGASAAENAAEEEGDNSLREEYFTETLAKVFVKQGNFERALEILTKINLENPRKNAYFADQIRFLQKLVSIKQQQGK